MHFVESRGGGTRVEEAHVTVELAKGDQIIRGIICSSTASESQASKARTKRSKLDRMAGIFRS